MGRIEVLTRISWRIEELSSLLVMKARIDLSTLILVMEAMDATDAVDAIDAADAAASAGVII